MSWQTLICGLKTVGWRLLWPVCKGFACVGILSVFMGILYSDSPSWPYRYFLHIKWMTPIRGELTVFWHEGRQKKIIKKVGGCAGDKIHIDAQGVLWVNTLKIGKPKTHDSKGQPLHPLKPQIIPEGYVFVYSPHDQSFDSRYQEMGLLPVKALQGKVIPLR